VSGRAKHAGTPPTAADELRTLIREAHEAAQELREASTVARALIDVLIPEAVHIAVAARVNPIITALGEQLDALDASIVGHFNESMESLRESIHRQIKGQATIVITNYDTTRKQMIKDGTWPSLPKD
jgi:hypothetical protein